MFKRKKKRTEPELKMDDVISSKERHFEKKTFFVTGTGYYQSSLMKLASPNPAWESSEPGTVFQYNFKKKPLVIDEDPDYPGSLRVKVDGLKIGVIGSDDVGEAKDIFQRDVKYMSAFISGGPYKTVCNNGDVLDDEKLITAKVSIGYVVEE